MISVPPRYAYLDDIPELWWAYFGGLFTGEGCIQIGEGLQPSIRMEVCDYVAVREVHRKLRGSFRRCPVRAAARQVQTPYAWSTSDIVHVFLIVRRIRPYVTGKKGKQLEALLRFTLLKIALNQERLRQSRGRYTPMEKFKLVRAARAVRDYAGGGNKGWRRRWSKWERELEKQAYAIMPQLEEVPRRKASKV